MTLLFLVVGFMSSVFVVVMSSDRSGSSTCMMPMHQNLSILQLNETSRLSMIVRVNVVLNRTLVDCD